MVDGFCKAPQTCLQLSARKANIVQDINVRGTYMVTCEFLKRLEGGPGVVLNVSSRSSYVTAPGMSAYQTSKSALNRSVRVTCFYTNILTFQAHRVCGQRYVNRQMFFWLLDSHEWIDYSSQGVVAIAFHPGGVPGTKVADNAPEWLRKTFKDSRKPFLLKFHSLLNCFFPSYPWLLHS